MRKRSAKEIREHAYDDELSPPTNRAERRQARKGFGGFGGRDERFKDGILPSNLRDTANLESTKKHP